MLFRYLYYKFLYILTKDIFYKYLYRNLIKTKNNKIILVYDNKEKIINHSYRSKGINIYFDGDNNIVKIKMPNKNNLFVEIHSNLSKVILDDEIVGSLGLEINGISNSIEIHKNNDEKNNKLENVKFFVEGEKNKLNVYPKMENCNINICGNECSVNIKNDVLLKNSNINISYPPEIVRNSIINIGKFTTFNGVGLQTFEDFSTIEIGEDCQFSWGIDVWCSDSHSIIDEDKNIINRGKNIKIGNHVWVGKDVKINKNTLIPNNCIIGWGSVVTHVFSEPNTIIAGNPAKIVKHNINWDRARINKFLEISQKG